MASTVIATRGSSSGMASIPRTMVRVRRYAVSRGSDRPGAVIDSVMRTPRDSSRPGIRVGLGLRAGGDDILLLGGADGGPIDIPERQVALGRDAGTVVVFGGEAGRLVAA